MTLCFSGDRLYLGRSPVRSGLSRVLGPWSEGETGRCLDPTRPLKSPVKVYCSVHSSPVSSFFLRSILCSLLKEGCLSDLFPVDVPLLSSSFSFIETLHPVGESLGLCLRHKRCLFLRCWLFLKPSSSSRVVCRWPVIVPGPVTKSLNPVGTSFYTVDQASPTDSLNSFPLPWRPAKDGTSALPSRHPPRTARRDSTEGLPCNLGAGNLLLRRRSSCLPSPHGSHLSQRSFRHDTLVSNVLTSVVSPLELLPGTGLPFLWSETRCRVPLESCSRRLLSY